MKVEIINVETIKPSSPTPVHLKTYTLSAFDQVAPSMFTSLVFAYPNVVSVAGGGYDNQFSQTLKNSLSDTLTLFPPLAGRIKDNSVDCNDDGVPCYESRVHSTLDLLLLHDMECLKHLVVVGGDDEVNVDTGPQLLVQINQFNCGGIAVGVSFSHKLCDAASFSTLIKSWSAKAINSSQVVVPDFTVSTNLPPRKDATSIRPIGPPRNDLISARLVFDGQKIAALKAKSASPTSTQQPTRVEAVTALISKCSMVASKANNESYLLPYVSLHLVNIRKKLVPSLPETAFGNVIGGYAVYTEQSDVSLDIMVEKLRKGRMEYSDSLALSTAQKEIDAYLQNLERKGVTSHGDALEVNMFTSWCRFGFNEFDFGLGKPIWVGPWVKPTQNTVFLLDTKDGDGVEALVIFPRQDMVLFQSDPLLLHYASVNPSL